MQKILLLSEADGVSNSIGKKALRFLRDKETESYIGISDFDIIIFDVSFLPKNSKIAIYFDKEDLFFFCENIETMNITEKIITDQIKDEKINNEHLLYHFFMSLIRKDTQILNKYEAMITDREEDLISGGKNENDRQIRMMQYRRELWQLRRKYEQMGMILAQLISNGNSLLSENGIKYMTVLDSRIDKLLAGTAGLRDYIAQVQDEYQSMLDYRQNSLMKVFTVVTSVFLPLTLLVGWYGMNFDMPEFSSPYGYPAVIGVSIAIAVVLIIIFKKKKWM